MSEVSTLSSDEAQDNLENVEGSVTTQCGCFQLWKEFVIKRNFHKCVVLAIGCVLAFDFFLQLQHKLTEIAYGLESEENIPEHSIQWTSVFAPLWLLTTFSLCQCLFNLICIEIGTGNRNALTFSGFTGYLCVAWGSAVSLGVSNGGYLTHFRHVICIVCVFSIDFLVDYVGLYVNGGTEKCLGRLSCLVIENL